MKKFLIASTALVMTAGVAAAEVTLSGDARLGLQYRSEGWEAGLQQSKTKLEKRVTFNVDGKTTADNGVTFGARIRLRSDEGTGSAISGGRVFARYQGFEVAGGNLLGAIESMSGLYGPSLGLTGVGYTGLVTNVGPGYTRYDDWDAFSSRANGAEGIEVLYSAGDFKGHLSYSSNKLKGESGKTADRLAATAAYTMNDWTLALGLQDGNRLDKRDDKVVFTAVGKMGDAGLGFSAAKNGSGANKINKFALNGSYTFGATTVSAFVAQESGHGSAVRPLLTHTKSTYGLGASYALGGNASVVGGVARTVEKDTRADLGVSFRF